MQGLVNLSSPALPENDELERRLAATGVLSSDQDTDTEYGRTC